MTDRCHSDPREKARCWLFISRGEIVAGRSRARGRSFRARSVRRTTAPSRESFAFAAIALEAATIDLRLRSGDEGGQAIDAASIRNRRLRLLLKWRLAALLAVFSRLGVVGVGTSSS